MPDYDVYSQHMCDEHTDRLSRRNKIAFVLVHSNLQLP
jgi:uncharacterized short protein YbdD (DUF466 family)